jgi:hypothetical protein
MNSASDPGKHLGKRSAKRVLNAAIAANIAIALTKYGAAASQWQPSNAPPLNDSNTPFQL